MSVSAAVRTSKEVNEEEQGCGCMGAYAEALEACEALGDHEYGTHKTVEARFWPDFSGKYPEHVLSCSRFDRKRLWVRTVRS